MTRLFRETFWHSDLRLVRAAIGLGSLIWAGILILGGVQFERPAYYYLAQVAPQQLWGIGFLLVGVLQFLRAFRGVPTSSGFYACTVAALCAFLWVCVTTALATALNPTPAINAGNIVISLLSCVVLVRAIARNG